MIFWRLNLSAQCEELRFLFSIRLFFHKTDDSQASRGKEATIFLPLYHFYQVTNIQVFMYNFACEMTTTCFWSHYLYLPSCYSMKFTAPLNYNLGDWWWNVNFCLFTRWFVSKYSIIATWRRKPGRIELISLSYHKRTNQPSAMVPVKVSAGLLFKMKKYCKSTSYEKWSRIINEY